MIVGAAQVDITPDSTVDLSGFAARTQPMEGILDPIHAKALYLEHAGESFLWLHCDVLALSREFVEAFREWAARELSIGQVLLSATHTHAAPATVSLTGCGRCNPAFLESLQLRARQAAKEATQRAVEGEFVFAQSEFPLAIDRRGKPSAHVDSTLSAIGWKRGNGEFIATLVNYPMHPVALGHVNRMISADWCFGTDLAIRKTLPGAPITLVTNGACGNLNPPARPVPARQTRLFGWSIAEAIAGKLWAARPSAEMLHIKVEHVDLPLDCMTANEIDQIAQARIDEFANTDWAIPFRDAISLWRDTQKALITQGKGKSIDIELFAVDFGPVVMLAISGELFSRFTALLRERIRKPVFVVGYANAVFGYIPTREAYAEGGYEVDQAHFFYNSFRPKIGGLEMLADRATELIGKLSSQR